MKSKEVGSSLLEVKDILRRIKEEHKTTHSPSLPKRAVAAHELQHRILVSQGRVLLDQLIAGM